MVTRRKFIFGLGAFAAGIFLPVKKLYFPVAENPAVFDLGDRFSMPSVEPDHPYNQTYLESWDVVYYKLGGGRDAT